MKLNLTSEIVHRSTRCAPTLKFALETFVSLAANDDKAAVYSIVNNSRGVRICKRTGMRSRTYPNTYTDLDFFIDLLAIIRRFAGKNWRPKRIALQFWPPAGDAMAVQFPHTRFLFDQTSSWIELPRKLLTLPKHTDESADDPIFGNEAGAREVVEFVHALKRALRAHMSEGYPDVDLAAAVTRTSVRTLQRNLARAGLTYSKVVEFARFEVAAEMLLNPTIKIIEIAYALGYQDPSHFSRAFRRLAGQSPREFRVNRIGSPALR